MRLSVVPPSLRPRRANARAASWPGSLTSPASSGPDQAGTPRLGAAPPPRRHHRVWPGQARGRIGRAQFTRHFTIAREAGLRGLPRGGETTGPATVWSALHDLGAEEIGYGINAVTDPRLPRGLPHVQPARSAHHDKFRQRAQMEDPSVTPPRADDARWV